MLRSRWLQLLLRVMFVVIFALAALFGFGITPGDWDKLMAFDRAVKRWQSNPDFHAVTFEYVDLGSRAMQTRFSGVRAKTAIMWFRKLPGLPPSIAINPTSRSHYDDFSAGPWAAYFHLCGEQDVPTGIAMIERLGANPTDEQIRQMLSSFKLPVATATDFGAVLSVRSLIADVDPNQPFVIRDKPFGPEKTHEADGYSNQQQMMLLRTLDKELRTKDHQRWRTKQVSDLLSGIWAQGYGQMYADAIGAVGVARIAGRITTVVLLVLGVSRLVATRSGARLEEKREDKERSAAPRG